jgi:hypothetical protein
MTKTNTFEDPTQNHDHLGRLILAGKLLGATAIASLATVGFVRSENYGYHPDRNPAPPTYLDTHKGINPANIDNAGAEK